MATCTLDIETSGLLEDLIDFTTTPYSLKEGSNIWVVSVCDVTSGGVSSLDGGYITKENIDNLLKPYDTICLHNGHKYDLPTLRLFGLIDYSIGYIGESDTLNGRAVRFIDTLLISRLMFPDRFGGHSLDSWGGRVGLSKINYRDRLIQAGLMEKSYPKGYEFTFYTPLMREYCERDVMVTSLTYKALLKEIKESPGDWKMALQMEHKLADLSVYREYTGFWFDKELALKNIEDLDKLISDISDKINPYFLKRS